ncbi:ribonuclease H-like domain-containing protein, partial [Tanacetum coccineum]
EESHKGLAPDKLSAKTPAVFLNPNLSKQYSFVKKFSGNNVDVSQTASTSTGIMSASFTNGQMMKLLSLIDEKPAANTNYYMYNVTLGWIIDFDANQHMTVSTKNMFNVVDISSLRLTVGHPNGTMAKIAAIGSLKLTKHVVLFDVLVVSEYNDLKLRKIARTGSESGRLYMFDCENSGKSAAGLCNSGVVCYVSKELWHCRLGHPANQVLLVLSDKIGFKSGNHVCACDIYHKAKQTKEPFLLSDHKSNKLGDLVHLDVWVVWVYLLKTKVDVFDCIEFFLKMVYTQFGINVKVVRSDNDTSVGIIHQSSCSYTPQQMRLLRENIDIY